MRKPKPVPEATTADPISVIVGGRAFTDDYGFKADAGLHYYAFGVGHGTERDTQHTGIDAGVPYGTPLYTPVFGVVRCIGDSGTPDWGQSCGAYNDFGDAAGGTKLGVGNITIMLDGGVKLTLGHCRKALVKVGDRVTAGQQVGVSGGMSGPHAHCECSVNRNGTYYLVEPRAALRPLMQPTPQPPPQPVPTPVRPATITLDTPYLQIGNYPAAIWDRDIPRTSPLYAIRHELRAIGDAANLGALLFEQFRKESSFANDASAQQSHNPLGLMVRDPKTEPFILVANGQRKLRVFATYQDAPREYVRRLTDPTEAYQSVGVKTLGELIARYLMGWIPGDPNRPFPPGENAESVRLYKQQVLDRIVTAFASVPTPVPTPTPDPKPVPTPPAKPNMTKGLIPMPPYTKRIITAQMKPEGIGWNNLGPRQPWGMSRHRMQGTLWGTDSFFHDATVKALTDFGIDHQTGEMLQWCDPFGTMTPWASGPVSAPYGDGAAFLAKWEAKYGKDVVNRMRVSLEIAGYFAQPGSSITADSPWSDISKHRFAQALAHFAHDDGIVWSDFPIAPDDGFSFLCDHIEFTKGTGKICPGVLVQKATDEVIQLTQDIMKSAQGGSVKPPVPVPTIVYPEGMDRALAADLFGRVESNGITYTYNEAGPVSRLWLDLGMTHQPHEFPRLERVVQSATGPDYFFFDGGRTLYRKDDNAAFVVLGDNPMDASRKAA